jgi:hypothetical protein
MYVYESYMSHTGVRTQLENTHGQPREENQVR